VETNTLNVLIEHKTNQGIKVLYNEFLNQKALNKEAFFADYLTIQIQNLPVEHQQHLLVISGMASANIGLHEMDYADMPIKKGGKSLHWKHLSLPNGLQVLLISGVKSHTGMMRGEEIQAVGLAELLTPYRTGVLLLPGTHSKHLYYKNSAFVDLKNYMTGELFELLAKKSILANSIIESKWSDEVELSYQAGIRLGLEGKVSESLFTIRVNDVLFDAKKENNYYFLSGLLIGDELSALKKYRGNVFLAASEAILTLYYKALTLVVKPEQIVLFDSKTNDNALLVGQKKILVQYVS